MQRAEKAPLPQLQWTQVYYYSTVVFALVDFVFGANVRAVGLDGAPGIRFGYYGACLLCAAAIRVRPNLAAPITLAESSINIGALVVSVFSAYYGMIDTIEGPGPMDNPITGRFILNFMIAGGAGTASFYQSMFAVERQLWGQAGAQPGDPPEGATSEGTASEGTTSEGTTSDGTWPGGDDSDNGALGG